jgi:hypothetical protein
MARRGATPYPRCFAKRVCKRLKTNDGDAKKRGKRKREAREKESLQIVERTGIVGE